MPICEADPWRVQYFEAAACPDHVRIPTEDADAWAWNPRHRWIYDKLAIAASQGLAAGPHGVEPPFYPVFSKPIVNLKGMGVGSRILRSAADYHRHYRPGHMWMELLTGDHVSTDVAVAAGRPRWWRHATGKPLRGNMFDYWTVHAAARPELEAPLSRWIARNMKGYSGMLNFETIGGRIIEAHMRFADQWPDLYGDGWVRALVGLYAGRGWRFADRERRDGFSVALFGRHGVHYRHPPASAVKAVLATPGVKSLQITFHENRPPEAHAMPPGGFRLAIVNATSLEAGLAGRARIARAFPAEAVLLPRHAHRLKAA